MPSLPELREWYNLPLTTLIFRAQAVHHRHQDPAGVQLCTLQSIKTGACPENCAYCPQSAHYETGLAPAPLMDTADILSRAREARAGGASRFCLGAAWREPRNGPQFDSVLRTVEGVSALGLEVCCTLGMLSPDQAVRLKDAGCRVYNHNLDTSREYYPNIISTRCYDDRLRTLQNVRAAGLEVCSGGILGLGETVDDRLKLLAELAALDPHPESVPINALVPVAGTPLAEQPPVDPIEFVRVIAVARLALPRSIIRLSAGRTEMSDEMQALCFLAGANSIFLGEKLLTTPNPEKANDFQLLHRLGLHALNPDDARKIHAATPAEQDAWAASCSTGCAG
jgi:biotin synthase